MKRNVESYIEMLKVEIELTKLKMELNDRLRSSMGEETYEDNLKRLFNMLADFDGMVKRAYDEIM